MSGISFRIWCEWQLCRTYGTPPIWVLCLSNRRVKTRRYRTGRADGTGTDSSALVTLLVIPLTDFSLRDYITIINPHQLPNAVGMTSLVTPGFNPVGWRPADVGEVP